MSMLSKTVIKQVITVFWMLTSQISRAQEVERTELLKVPFATGEYRPYSSENMPSFGAATDLIAAICNAAGIQPQFVFLPWRRIESELVKGSVFGAFPYSENPERKLHFDFSDGLYWVSYSIIYHDANPKLQTLSGNEELPALKGFRFGVIAGSFAETRLKELGTAYDAVTTVDQLVAMLRFNRFEFYIDDEVIVLDAARRLFPTEVGNFKVLKSSFDERNANLMVSRSYPDAAEILKKFNTGLAKIKKTGEYDRVLAKHHLQHEKSNSKNMQIAPELKN
jgi:polar amino acid transport system substrate-binding protein